jgi:antitoxin YefM
MFKKGVEFMLAVNYFTIRNKLKEYCDKVTDNYETIIVTRKDEKNVVIISLEEYNAIMKAARNAAYMDMIDRSLQQVESGRVVTRTLAELEAMERE